jgi:hypothetical protein
VEDNRAGRGVRMIIIMAGINIINTTKVNMLFDVKRTNSLWVTQDTLIIPINNSETSINNAIYRTANLYIVDKMFEKIFICYFGNNLQY